MKIAIVTGASSGMGRESVIEIGDRFPGIEEIWVIARREERLEELSSNVAAVVRILPLNLSDSKGLETLRLRLQEYQPDVKILVNSAGFGKIGRSETLLEGDETGMIRLNCETLCAVTHMVLPYMSKNSRILQFASAAAFLPQPGFAVYAATKSFVLSYSCALHAELRPRGIGVTAVCPGPVKTEFFDIAGSTGRMQAYKKLAMANAKNVVKKAMRDSMMGKSVSIYGALMNSFYVLSKIIPHKVLLAIMERI